MIKEPEKRRIRKKTRTQIIMEYVRTVSVSFLCALVFTLMLSIHARSEMIKNLYVDAEEQQKMDEQLALQLVKQSDFTKDLRSKKYSICLQVGNLYEAAHQYEKAQLAYELAVEKAKPGVYTPYRKLAVVLISQEKFDEANKLLDSIFDVNNKQLIKFKTRAYIVMGDKYYSIGKFLSAAKSYEKAKFYYDKFVIKDESIDESIKTRIVNSYIKTADVMVKNNYNSDAVRFLKKAEVYEPDNFYIQYKLAIIYADLDPIQSVKYFEPLLDKKPQDIDYGVYTKALMKSANIADLEGKPTLAKYYRYKIHSVDLFINQKVIYKNDIEISLNSFTVRKLWFKYRLKASYIIKNVSNSDINKLSAEFVLRQKDKTKEVVQAVCVKKSKPLRPDSESGDIKVVFGKNIFTRKELEQYTIDIYLFKDERYKTYIGTMKVPVKSIKSKDSVLSLIDF